jgi:hypothetical protein
MAGLIKSFLRRFPFRPELRNPGLEFGANYEH